MRMIEVLKGRIEEIGGEVMTLVANQQISLTEKNRKMKPLIDEKKVLEKALLELQAIETADYSGRCHG